MRKIARAFTGLAAAALAVGGQHILLDRQAGQALGRQVGEFTLRHVQSGHAHPG